MTEKKLEIDSALLRHLFAYWDSRRQGRPFPRRSEIDPVDIPRLLPHVFLITVERQDGMRFLFRLAGTHVEAAFQQFATGRYLDQLKLNGQISDILARYRECVETARPVFSRQVFVNQDLRRFDYRRLLLPLAGTDDTSVDMILGGVCFDAPLTTPSVMSGGSRSSRERPAYS